MSITKPKISIIIPVYNSEKHLNKCLEHLKNQTCHEIEVLCVDDGSKDKSYEILQKYTSEDSRFKIFRQKNFGPASARNLGLKTASGEYIMFCDSDDWFELNMCEVMLKSIQESKVDLAMCDVKFHQLDTNHKRSFENIFQSHKLKIFGKIKFNKFNRIKIFVVLWNKIFKKSIIDDFNISFPTGFEFDDDSFVYQYISASKDFFGSSEKLYNYSIHSNTIMSRLNFEEKYTHCIGSLSFTVSKLLENHRSVQWDFVSYIITNKIVWFLRHLPADICPLFISALKTEVLIKIPNYVFFEEKQLKVLKNTDAYQYKKILKQLSSVKEYKTLGITFFKIQTSVSKTSLYILGIQIFKKKNNPSSSQFYFMGILFFLSKA